MNRRHFVISSASAVVSNCLFRCDLYDLVFAQPRRTRISGDFEFSWQRGKLKLKAKDVIIDGLTIPKFTWAWIGLGVAQGVLSAFGGAVFSALANAILGSGKSLEQLLNEQLEEIARIVEEQLQENDLRNYQARIAAFAGLFREYRNSPTASRLEYLVNHSAESLSQIESLGFKGYRTYMTAAGLRLTVLQEVTRRGRSVGNRENFREQRLHSIEVHTNIIREIEAKTDPQTYASENIQDLITVTVPITRPILGIKPRDLPLVSSPPAVPIVVRPSDAQAPNFVNWQALRTLIKAQNTDLGAKMVARWNRA